MYAVKSHMVDGGGSFVILVCMCVCMCVVCVDVCEDVDMLPLPGCSTRLSN